MNETIVAVIDTGISPNVSYSEDIIEHKMLYIENQSIYLTDEKCDHIGHGTKVASCIKRIAPEAKLIDINIYRNLRVTSSVLILEALKYLLNVKVDIINISLAINTKQYIGEIDDVLEQLKLQGKIIVASVKNGLNTSFPADSEYSIGVLGAKNVARGRFWAYSEKRIQIITSKMPDVVESIGGKRELFGGNSKAAAVTTGCIAKGMIIESICGNNYATIIDYLGGYNEEGCRI